MTWIDWRGGHRLGVLLLVGLLGGAPQAQVTERPRRFVGLAQSANRVAPVTMDPHGLPVLFVLDPLELCQSGGAVEVEPSDRPVWLLERPSVEQEPCWLAALANLAASRPGATYLVAEEPAPTPDAVSYLLLLKRTAVALRAADLRASIVAGPLSRAGLADWVDPFVAGEPAPYTDGLAADPDELDRVLGLRARSFAALPVWLVEQAPPPVSNEDALARAAAGLARGAEAVWVQAASDAEVRALSVLAAALPENSQLPPASAAASAGNAVSPLLDVLGGPLGQDRLLVVPPHRATIELSLGPPLAARAELLDPFTGECGAAELTPGPAYTALLRLAPAVHVGLVTLHTREDLTGELVGVESHKELSVGEIIAREREARARQGLSLANFRAGARISYLFSIANLGESVDVVTENEAFGRGDAVEYRETALYINGAKWRGPAPQFPFIAPERVKDIPLQLVLNEAYSYRLLGREEQEGRSCYRIAFDPRTSEADFRGTVWIDEETFMRTRLDLARLHPAPPVTSDALSQWFEPVATDAGTFWLMTHLRGQMSFSALGQDALLERRIVFQDFEVNAPGFEEERAEAHASDDPMYRDSLEEGLVTLGPGAAGGERSAQPASVDSNTLLVSGIGADSDADFGLPFAAINWFDMNYKDTGAQMDLLWAGPFAGLSMTWPDEGGGWERSLQARGAAIFKKERYADETGRDSAQDVRVMNEQVEGYFRRRLTPRLRLTLNPAIAYHAFRSHHDTDSTFVVPTDTWAPALAARLDYQRHGYRLGAFTEAEHRMKWEAFGLPADIAAGQNFSKTPVRYGLQFNKNFYPRHVDQFSMDFELRDGANLDRYSRHRRDDFEGVSIRGYGSSGLRFDRGIVADFGYAPHLSDRFRLELLTGGALFESAEDYGPGYEHAVGLGLALSLPGPAGTLMRFRASHGLESSLPVDGDGLSLRFTLYKTFRGWWPWSRRSDTEGESPLAAPPGGDAPFGGTR